LATQRDNRRAILSSAIDQFLDHLEQDFGPDDELGAVVIAGELWLAEEDSTIPTYWSSNENAIWQRGFFEVLADYRKVPPTHDDD
jgi:hypothetical protein